MISVFQDKLSMELIYIMKYIFTEDQCGGLYEGSKDNPNKIPNYDLIKRGDITTLMIKICKPNFVFWQIVFTSMWM